MLQKILNLLLILSTSTLVYISNTNLINVSIFLLIFLTLLNKNHYSLISIIPLFFINKTAFVILLITWVMLYIITNKIINKYIKSGGFLITGIIFLCYELLINSINYKIILMLFSILIIIILIYLFQNKLSKITNVNIIFLTLSIINLQHINIYIFILLYIIFLIYEILTFNECYYIATAFLITIYGMFVVKNFAYISIQILAYLGYFFKNVNRSKTSNAELEYALENINNNVTEFCNFLNSFSKITYNNDYEKRLSDAIKILIESHCLTCKDRNVCYTTKKIKTYIYLKELLTKKGLENFTLEFNCRNYFNMIERANQLQVKYDLYFANNLDDIKIIGICSSIQNYFVSAFEKVRPEILQLSNFKKVLLDSNISFYNFEQKITDETNFEFKIYSSYPKDLLEIEKMANNYFDTKKITTEIRNGYIYICPLKNYKVLYDQASMSLNNCQISGDNILFKNIHGVNFVCALSDGMGSGYYAYQLSQETLKMVDNITNCNISFDTSLQILNNFFRTRDLSESYATLDLVNIDLISGTLNLYKLGSSTTYLSRGDKIIPIYNNNLPFGINDLITKEEFQLNDEDLIVLVSDGVNDYIDEESLTKYIQTIKHELPHKIVYEILQKIYHENKNTIKDDMSCVAIKIKNIQ